MFLSIFYAIYNALFVFILIKYLIRSLEIQNLRDRNSELYNRIYKLTREKFFLKHKLKKIKEKVYD